MSTPTALLPWIELRFLDAEGAPLAGGQVASYEAGTSTPKATYTDSGLTTPHANPIVLNADGRPPSPIYLADGGYKFIVADADDVTQYSIDDVGDVGQTIAEEVTGTVYNASLANNASLADATWADLGLAITSVPTTGTYAINAQVSFDSLASTRFLRAEIRVNGTAVARGLAGGNDNVPDQYVQINVSAITALTAGDTITLWAYSSTAWTVIAGATYTYLNYVQLA